MNVHEQFACFGFALKQRVFRPTAWRTYQEAMRNQVLPGELIDELNWRKRNRLFCHAYEHVPYYRETFRAAGLTPDRLRSPDDWRRVPILRREDLATNQYRLVANNVKRELLRSSATGGSTGKPVRVFHDRRYPQEVLGWRMLTWWGLRPGMDAAHCLRSIRSSATARLVNKMLWWPTKRLWLNASELNARSIEKFLREFNIAKPPLLQGYVGGIQEVAQYCERKSIQVHSPKAVWVTASPLSKVTRTLIERVFQCPVYDQYGCGEVFWLAAECKERRGLHVFSDARHIEFLRDDGSECLPGEVGEIVVTDLENHAFPLIRYANGDRGAPMQGKCSCGTGLPLMHPVQGRVLDAIRLPDGSAMFGITTLFNDYPEAVTSFEVLQHADYSITLRVTYNDRCPTAHAGVDAACRKLRTMTKGQVEISVVATQSGEHDRGKLRFVRSEVEV